jgi:dienelactone hydrolase
MRKRAVTSIITVTVVLVLAISGIGWYFSSKAEAIDHSPNYSVRVQRVAGNSITLARTHDDVLPGAYGINWPGGRATVGPVTSLTPKSVTRQLSGPAPKQRSKVEWNTDVFSGDPSSVGLSFTDVNVSTSLGPMPAWFVPAAGKTWVIIVHGHNADRNTGLRITPTIHEAGLPILDITYRNDAGAPASRDRKQHLGATEWHDVDSAMSYAAANGATSVVLYGFSQGGSMVLETARHSANAKMIKSIILDSPVIDWRNTLDSQGASYGLPTFETHIAEKIFSLRTGFSFDDMNQLKHVNDFHVPMLLFYGSSDNYVPTAPAVAFARARPDLVKARKVQGSTHVGEWNVNPTEYDAQVANFIS